MSEYKSSPAGKTSQKKYRDKPASKAAQSVYGKTHNQLPAIREARKKSMKKYLKALCGYLHHRWNTVKQRCENPNNIGYSKYGGVGVKCLFTFDAFYNHVVNDLGLNTVAKLKGKQIHRINNKNYRRGDIEFLTPKQHRQKHIKHKKETVV